jgi:hypothetical protein
METPSAARKPRRPFPFVAAGGVAALLLGLGRAWAFMSGPRSRPAPPAAEGGLVIDSSGVVENGEVDPARPLRCFVQGRYVGEFSLTECARRNGVATDALDVGLDQSGALAAADQAGQTLVPLPPAAAAQVPPDQAAVAPDDTDPALPVASDDSCWRYGGKRWRRLASDMDLDACIQTLYAGRCERLGDASYGRWGGQTLRLVPGRVEISDDNRNFRPIAPQAPDCSIGPVG